MKKLLGVLLVTVTALFGLTACGNESPGGSGDTGENGGAASSDVLIAYFSCTNTTEAIAEHIEAETKGTLYEIVPQVPYTADDLKYYTNCRADREQADSTARPEINGSVEDMAKYDVIFLGYPHMARASA